MSLFHLKVSCLLGGFREGSWQRIVRFLWIWRLLGVKESDGTGITRVSRGFANDNGSFDQ
jgi:hypothetical protein